MADSCFEQIGPRQCHTIGLSNPRHACTVRVIVLGMCVCVSVGLSDGLFSDVERLKLVGFICMSAFSSLVFHPSFEELFGFIDDSCVTMTPC